MVEHEGLLFITFLRVGHVTLSLEHVPYYYIRHYYIWYIADPGVHGVFEIRL
jgi:hypothetical protein